MQSVPTSLGQFLGPRLRVLSDDRPGFRPFTRKPQSSELRVLEKSRGQLQPLSSVAAVRGIGRIAGRSREAARDRLKEAARDRSAERKMTKMFGHVGRHLIRYMSSDCSAALPQYREEFNSRLWIGSRLKITWQPTSYQLNSYFKASLCSMFHAMEIAA